MRNDYILDTLEVIGSNTITMDGTVKELKAFSATMTFLGWTSSTRILTFNLTSGNIAQLGTITFTDGVNSDTFNYDASSTVPTGTIFSVIAHRLTSTATLVSGVSTGTHSKSITAREAVKIVNNGPAALAVGFNGNIAVGGNGIQIPSGEDEVFPIVEDIPIYATAAAGNVTILEYK